jgi:hypothetical protein
MICSFGDMEIEQNILITCIWDIDFSSFGGSYTSYISEVVCVMQVTSEYL